MLKLKILSVLIGTVTFCNAQHENNLDAMTALLLPDMGALIDSTSWMLDIGGGVEVNLKNWNAGWGAFTNLGYDRIIRLESPGDTTLILIAVPQTKKYFATDRLQLIKCYKFRRSTDVIPLSLIDESRYGSNLFLTMEGWRPGADDPSPDYARQIILEIDRGSTTMLRIKLLGGDYGDATLTFTADSVVPKIDRHE